MEVTVEMLMEQSTNYEYYEGVVKQIKEHYDTMYQMATEQVRLAFFDDSPCKTDDTEVSPDMLTQQRLNLEYWEKVRNNNAHLINTLYMDASYEVRKEYFDARKELDNE